MNHLGDVSWHCGTGLYCDVNFLVYDVTMGQCDVTLSVEVTQVANEIMVRSNMFLIVD